MGKHNRRTWVNCIFQWVPVGFGVAVLLLMALMLYGAIVLTPRGGNVDNVFMVLASSIVIAVLGLPLAAGTISFIKSRVNTKFTFKQTYKFSNNDYTR